MGRIYVVETIAMNSNIIIILKQIENEKKVVNEMITKQAETNDTTNGAGGTNSERIAYKKGPILNYAIDLIDMTVRYATTNLEYLRQHGQIIVNLVKSHDQFDSPISQVLQETAVYLKPLQIQNVFSYDNIGQLCEVIKRSMDFITTFPGDLIMALRIICYLAIPDTRTIDADSDFADTFADAGISTSMTQNKFKLQHEQHQIELKYKFVLLQFYSADGMSTCISILDKINAYFSQPAVHTATLGSNTGTLLIQILLPTMKILRKMLTYVIECRNTEFKDLTAIEPILKTYTLISYVPLQSIAADDVQEIQTEVIKTLMAYTQPTPANGVDNESVHKSLWAQMIGELCKYTMNGPYTFTTGLTLFTHLLPIPLPIPTRRMLTQAEQARLVSDRQWWSAHLHPRSQEIADMIQSLCISSYSPLLDLLARVIGQLADLAPNMALLTTTAITDLLLTNGSSSIQLNELQNGSTPAATTPNATTTTINANPPEASHIMAYVNPQTKRILAFLSSIIGYPTIKVAFLSILQGKTRSLHEFLLKILTTKSSSIPSALWPILSQEQEYVLTIFHTILNADISLLNNSETGTMEKASIPYELAIGCSLPPKDYLLGIIATVLDWFFTVDEALNTFGSQFAALKIMTILSEYE